MSWHTIAARAVARAELSNPTPRIDPQAGDGDQSGAFPLIEQQDETCLLQTQVERLTAENENLTVALNVLRSALAAAEEDLAGRERDLVAVRQSRDNLGNKLASHVELARIWQLRFEQKQHELACLRRNVRAAVNEEV